MNCLLNSKTLRTLFSPRIVFFTCLLFFRSWQRQQKNFQKVVTVGNTEQWVRVKRCHHVIIFYEELLLLSLFSPRTFILFEITVVLTVSSILGNGNLKVVSCSLLWQIYALFWCSRNIIIQKIIRLCPNLQQNTVSFFVVVMAAPLLDNSGVGWVVNRYLDMILESIPEHKVLILDPFTVSLLF